MTATYRPFITALVRGFLPMLLLLVIFHAGIAAATEQNGTYIDRDARIVHLTHVPCQIVQAENNVDHQFNAWHESHCRRINRKTGADRLKKATALTLTEGQWTYIIQNRNVPWKVGFWLRAEQVSDRLSLPKAELSGYLAAGENGRVTVTLKAGSYVYSCPYNPTLPYRLIVIGD